MCGKEYEDYHIVPRPLFTPKWCDKCTEEVNRACGGSWVGAAYQASKSNPFESDITGELEE